MLTFDEEGLMRVVLMQAYALFRTCAVAIQTQRSDPLRSSQLGIASKFRPVRTPDSACEAWSENNAKGLNDEEYLDV
ncbi:hypothetical protein C0995_010152 [Termitomyces sp. Mi166|nr:hypothetical protein C0995_010152 [Termitomyces sp. Mi166\